MLNSETKRKIDNARDILVWKIPVPMSQIEQITLALIYKFMSDIDEQNKELWWKSYFEWEFEKYAWNNLMNVRLGAQERINIYSEGLDSMIRNINIPELFRDIFRNAYLPFKDPQTLDRFLKQINEFNYDHSEELWNAFEYLLSTAWSQWDAWQFRTPRHIIDFLVETVEPTKNDTILDPACWTAWFLISAYKYILEQNKDKVPWDKLTWEEKEKLTKNINWYDISHDMVRLSLVNLYLHNFANPKISEYDTLSSEDKWNDDYSCMLANPPFMTPKGWIEPHNRFSIKAKKSEVLFVDYIMEHLTLNWKAWIIIPEWIIFQSANAYKELRKRMIEMNFLYAVVSLPAGIFQPYSWVKTSVLLFDKQIAKNTDDILFVKIENDWFDLWAQRREIKKNDLPNAVEDILNYKKSILDKTEVEFKNTSNLIIPKAQIKDSWDYNLTAERYRVSDIIQNSDFDMVELEKLVNIKTWKKDVNEWNKNWKYPFFTCAKLHTYSDNYSFDTEALLIAWNWDVWSVQYYKWKFEAYQRTYVLDNFINVLPKYLYVCLNIKLKETVSKLKLWNTMPYIKLWMLKEFQLPLPPLEVQELIVSELNGYQKIIDWAKAVVDNYKPKIKIEDSWDIVELGEVIELLTDYHANGSYQSLKQNVTLKDKKDYAWMIRSTDFENNFSNKFKYINKNAYDFLSKSKVENGDLIINKIGNAGKVYIVPNLKEPCSLAMNQFLLRLNKNKAINKFIYFYLKQPIGKKEIMNRVRWVTTKTIDKNNVRSLKISLPNIEIQKQIVERIEEEQKLVNASKKLIKIFEEKIKEKISEVWGEEK